MTTVTIDAADPATKIVTGTEAKRANRESNGIVTAYVTVDSGDPSDIKVAPVESLAKVYPGNPVPNILPLFPRGRPMWAVVGGDSGDKVKVESQVGRTVGEPSNAYVRATTIANPADSTEEVNADQTATVSAGDSQASTITATAGELWTLRGMKLQVNSTGGGTANFHSFTVETESEAVEIAKGEIEESDALIYASGEWGMSSPNVARANVDGTRIDSESGVTVTYKVDSGASNQTNTRTIRLLFDVVETG